MQQSFGEWHSQKKLQTACAPVLQVPRFQRWPRVQALGKEIAIDMRRGARPQEPLYPDARFFATRLRPVPGREAIASGELPSLAQSRAHGPATRAFRVERNEAVLWRRNLRARFAREFRRLTIEQVRRAFRLLSQIVAR